MQEKCNSYFEVLRLSFEAFTFDPIEELGVDIPRNKRREALEEAAQFIKDTMLAYIGDGKSPVSGGKWVKSLTKEYLKRKAELSSAGFANLELSGDLLDSFDVQATAKDITIDVAEDQYGKAEGHITGLYGENSRIRPRQFMPQPGESLKRDIMAGVRKILKEFEDG